MKSLLTSRRKDHSSITSQQVSISQNSIEISHRGNPVSGTSITGHAYLLIDCSGSMQANNKLKQAKKGALNFAKDALAKNYLTGLIQFESSAKLMCEPGSNLSALENGLSNLAIGDLTHMANAINLGYNLLNNHSGQRVMVIVTDGMPNGDGDPHSSLKSAERAKKDGIDIITIGTDDADEQFLKLLASRTQLGVKVNSQHLEKTITDSAMLLPGPKGITRK
jgi:Mg-chelatase subunit ChlD